MMKSEEEFDDLFKDKLSESSGHYSPENWERMKILLNASHGAKGVFIWSRLNNLVAVVGVGVGAFVGSHVFFPESTASKLDFTKKIDKEITTSYKIDPQINSLNNVSGNNHLLSGSNDTVDTTPCAHQTDFFACVQSGRNRTAAATRGMSVHFIPRLRHSAGTPRRVGL